VVRPEDERTGPIRQTGRPPPGEAGFEDTRVGASLANLARPRITALRTTDEPAEDRAERAAHDVPGLARREQHSVRGPELEANREHLEGVSH